MVRILIVFLFLILNTGFLSCQSVPVKNFDELFNSLKEGKNVRVIIYYAKSKLVVDGKEEKSPDAVGGMDMKTFEYFAKGSVKNERSFITSSETILISHPRYGYVYNYIKIRIYDDDKVEIIARYLDPKTYEVKMDETFYSSMNNKNNSAAVHFFAN